MKSKARVSTSVEGLGMLSLLCLLGILSLLFLLLLLTVMMATRWRCVGMNMRISSMAMPLSGGCENDGHTLTWLWKLVRRRLVAVSATTTTTTSTTTIMTDATTALASVLRRKDESKTKNSERTETQ